MVKVYLHPFNSSTPYFANAMQKVLLGLLSLCFGFGVKAQRVIVKDSLQPGKVIVMIRAERYNMQKLDSNKTFLSLAGNAKVQQENTFFDADSIVLNQNANTLEAFGNVHINDADSVHTYAQYVKYLGKEKVAYLKNNVKLTDGKGILTTNNLTYNVGIKMGEYKDGGKLVNGKTTLTSKEGYYYGDTRDVYFKKKVVLINPEYKILTDTLLYNLNTEITNFNVPTTIYNGKRIIKTKEGYYDLKTKKAQFGKRSFIDDTTYTLTADDMAFEDSSGLGEARGNVVYKSKDTLNGQDLIANNIKVDNKKGSFLATQKPILFIRQDKDTIFVTADTLFSIKISNPKKEKQKGKKEAKEASDSLRYFEAYSHVKIYSDSLQAVCDSLFYSTTDSLFRLFKNPVVWAKDNQITGDTIYFFTKNKKPLKLEVWENAVSISKLNDKYFNQVQGNRIDGFFINGEIDFLQTKGSPANSVYYAQDEANKLVGVNASTSDVISIKFINNKPEKVKFINNLQGTMHPIHQVDHKDIRVKGFNWNDDKRPKSKFDILAS